MRHDDGTPEFLESPYHVGVGGRDTNHVRGISSTLTKSRLWGIKSSDPSSVFLILYITILSFSKKETGVNNMALVSSKIHSTRRHVFAASPALLKSDRKQAMFCRAIVLSI